MLGRVCRQDEPGTITMSESLDIFFVGWPVWLLCAIFYVGVVLSEADRRSVFVVGLKGGLCIGLLLFLLLNPLRCSGSASGSSTFGPGPLIGLLLLPLIVAAWFLPGFCAASGLALLHRETGWRKLVAVPLLIAAALPVALVLADSNLPQLKITLVVVSDEGSPVEGAEVRFLFPSPGAFDGQSLQRRDRITDWEGRATARGASAGSVGIEVEAEGSYPTTTSFDFEERSFWRWLPWNDVRRVVLREIRNPVAMYAKRMRKGMPAFDKDVGFDFEVGDFVEPYGVGKQADMIFHGTLRRTDAWNFDSRLVVSFPNPGDGIQEFDQSKYAQSRLQSPYEAPESDYESEWVQIRKREGIQEPVTGNYNENRHFIIRVRTVLDDQGRVASANYGKIYGDFIGFTYYFNPEPNDRSLEFDSDQNLLEDSLKGSERVSQP